MTKLRISALLVCLSAAINAEDRSAARNVVVYSEPGRYGGWPANHGIWSWGNEILVGFEAGYFKYNDKRHSIDWDRPAQHVLARSLDGGETWTIEIPESLKPPGGAKVAGVPTEPGGKLPVDCPGGIDFTNPNFAMTLRMEDIHVGPSRFYYSYDHGKTWNGPFRIPNFGQKGIAARTDYLVNGKRDLTVFLTAAKSDGQQGRAICVRTKDGGKTWKLVSFIGPEPDAKDKAIMPSSVRLPSRAILTALRHPSWIDLWRSNDDGVTWTFVSKAATDTGAHNGNPPCLVRLRDGRIAITYGFRSEPYGVRARLSTDEGKTWSDDLALRSDGGTWDLGYTRTVQRPDGKLVTIYYFNDRTDSERYIAATIWDPERVSFRDLSQR
jgi:BNR repeat-like domain